MTTENHQLPKTWVKARLADLVKPTRPKHSPQDFPDLQFIGMENVEAHTMRLLGTVPASSMRSNAVHFHPSDVLYGRLRPYLNKVYCPNFEGLCSAEFIVFPAPDWIEPKFLQYFLNSSEFVSFASHLNAGDRPRVNLDQIGEYHFPLVPLLEQKRIVAEIEKQFTRLDAAVAALKRVQANLKRYRVAVLKAACEGRLVLTEAELARREGRSYEPASVLLERVLVERRSRWEAKFRPSGDQPSDNWKVKYPGPETPDVSTLPSLPQGWTWATLSQLSQIQGGIQKQPSRKPVQNRHPFLRVANVLRGRLDLSEVHEIELFKGELEKLRLEAGDLLIVEGNGSPSEIGRMAIWMGEIENCVHQNHIIRSRLLGAIPPAYVAAYWNSSTGASSVLNVASSTSGLYTLSVNKVGRLPVPLPPLAEQGRIIAELERRLSVIDELDFQVEANLKRSDRLRQAILKSAFEGKLVQQDPADEPASLLLERIRGTATLGCADTRPPRKSKRQ